MKNIEELFKGANLKHANRFIEKLKSMSDGKDNYLEFSNKDLGIFFKSRSTSSIIIKTLLENNIIEIDHNYSSVNGVSKSYRLNKEYLPIEKQPTIDRTKYIKPISKLEVMNNIISEEDFFAVDGRGYIGDEDHPRYIEEPVENSRTVSFKYKGFKDITIIIRDTHKKLFKECVDLLKVNGLEVSWTTMEQFKFRFDDEYIYYYITNLYLERQKTPIL